MHVIDLIRLLGEIPEDCYEWDITVRDISPFSKNIVVEYNDGGHEYTPEVIISGIDLPYEQFPYGQIPRSKPHHWDEYKDFKARGLLPDGAKLV